MKFRMALLVLSVASATAAPDKPDEPDMSTNLSVKLEGDFPYSLPTTSDKSLTPDPTVRQPALVMAPVIVTDKEPNRQLTEKMEEENAKDSAFTWKNGGRILKLGPVILEMKYDPKIRRFKILELDW